MSRSFPPLILIFTFINLFFLLLHYMAFTWFEVLYFNVIPVYEGVSFYVYICFLCLFLDFSLLVLSYVDVTVFVLFWYYPLAPFLFSTKRQNGSGSDWRRWGGTGRRGRESIIRIYYLREKLFSIKEKNKFKKEGERKGRHGIPACRRLKKKHFEFEGSLFYIAICKTRLEHIGKLWFLMN